MSPHPTRAEIGARYLAAFRWKVAERRYFDRQHELGAEFGFISTSDPLLSARCAALCDVEGRHNFDVLMQWTTPDAIAAELAAIDAEASEIARRP